MQYDNIYMFDIFYEGKDGKDTFYKIYSDEESVFALKDLPDTTYKIERRHLMKDFDGNFSFSYSMYDEDFTDEPDEFWVGQKLLLKDLKNEIDKATDIKRREQLRRWYNSITKGDWGHIGGVVLRLNNGSLIYERNAYSERVVGVIRNGQVVKRSQASQTEQISQSEQTSKSDKTSKKGYGNDNYISLE